MTRFIIPCLIEKDGQLIESKIQTLAFDAEHADKIARNITKAKGITEDKIEFGRPEKI